MGSVSAVVFLLATVTFIPIPFVSHIVGDTSFKIFPSAPTAGRFLTQFPLNNLASYLSALLPVQSIIILGIFDDLLDLRWHKMLIPLVSSIPLLIMYFVNYGVTSIVLPLPLRPFLDGAEIFDLGLGYYLYMSLLTVFCTNSINILAGINGIEVLQSLVIAFLIMCHNALHLFPIPCPLTGLPIPHPAAEAHRSSLYLLLPYFGTSLALFYYNKYPAKVFVGDTFCYFSGTVFAAVGILGHFSKTMWLLFVPQAFNFVYSMPQLFGILHCPRHRLPRFNIETGRLECSTYTIKWNPSSERIFDRLLVRALTTIGKLRLGRVRLDPDKKVLEVSNFTLINLWLIWRGPMREDRLAWELTAFQMVTGIIGLLARHRLSALIFGRDAI